MQEYEEIKKQVQEPFKKEVIDVNADETVEIINKIAHKSNKFKGAIEKW